MGEKDQTEERICPVCHEVAVDVRFEDDSLMVDCLDCGRYEILPLAAQHIQDFPEEVRLRLLERAQMALGAQDSGPLIREPFDLG